MGEHTHPHIEGLPRTECQSQIEASVSNQNPNSDSKGLIPHSEEASHGVPDGISYNPQNPSKIPIRPPKMRKLSYPSSVPVDKKSSLQTTGFDPPLAVSSSLALTASATAVVITPVAPVAKNRRRSSSLACRIAPRFIRPLSAEGELEIALNHLRSVDPLLSALIDSYPPPQFEIYPSPFVSLTKSIIYQQLDLKAGTSIYTRFIALCGGEESVSPDSVLALSFQQLKQIRVSGRKASYLYDLANKYKSGILSDDFIVKMDDKSLFTMLSMVKGIGSWSVHMFMIFSLHRPDVLPVSDLGVRRGVQLLYDLAELPRPSHMEQLCEKWRPYRSVASWYLWRFIEGKASPSTVNAVSLESGVVQPLPQIESQPDGHQLQFVEGIRTMGACIWNQ